MSNLASFMWGEMLRTHALMRHTVSNQVLSSLARSAHARRVSQSGAKPLELSNGMALTPRCSQWAMAERCSPLWKA